MLGRETETLPERGYIMRTPDVYSIPICILQAVAELLNLRDPHPDRQGTLESLILHVWLAEPELNHSFPILEASVNDPSRVALSSRTSRL